MAQRKTALATDPSANKKPVPMDNAATARREQRINYLKRIRPNDPEIKRLEGLVQQYRSTNPAQQQGQAQLTPEQMAQQGMQGGFSAYQQLANRYQTSDPYQMQQQYSPYFGQEMERQRENLMETFNRRNAEEFARQDVATQQSIAERGLDPNGPAAQALMKANTQRQDLARQEAMSAAEKDALAAQQQYYLQAYQTGMAPYAQYEYLQQPYTLGSQNYYQQQQLTQQQAFERAQQQRNLAAQERMARMRGSGGGAAAVDPMDAFYDQQIGSGYGPQGASPNPTASFIQGATAAVGSQIGKQR
jgi:hypothetical protein